MNKFAPRILGYVTKQRLSERTLRETQLNKPARQGADFCQ